MRVMIHFLPTLIVASLFLFAQPSFGKKEPVSCGSVIKLIHKHTSYNLHSHPIAWGSGSGQQSVTTQSGQSDHGSYWLVKEGYNSQLCEAATAIKCNSIVRLEHVNTGKNLHSHHFKAPLSGNQEVSGYGDAGNGDTGDNWEILCDAGEQYWRRGNIVQFKHQDTGKYLTTSETAVFNQGNCGGNCPIMGQTEVSAGHYSDKKTKWVTGQGIYYPAKVEEEPVDDEL